MRLAVDPGVDTGWALFDDGATLLDCGLGAPPIVPAGTRVVIERPQVYLQRQAPGDPNDLITLAIQVGRYTERLESQGGSVSHVLPRAWKGTVDADVCCRRIEAALSDADRALLHRVLAPLARSPLGPKTLTDGRRHNVIDAVGLGRWALHRGRPCQF